MVGMAIGILQDCGNLFYVFNGGACGLMYYMYGGPVGSHIWYWRRLVHTCWYCTL